MLPSADVGKLVKLMEHVRRNYTKRAQTVESFLLDLESRSGILSDTTLTGRAVESILIDPGGKTCEPVRPKGDEKNDLISELVKTHVHILDSQKLLPSPAYVDGSSRLVRDLIYNVGVFASAYYQPDRGLIAAYPSLGRTYGFEVEDDLNNAYSNLGQGDFSFDRDVHFLSINEDPSLSSGTSYAYTRPHVYIGGLGSLGGRLHLPLFSYVGYNTGTMEDENRLILEFLAVLDAAKKTANIIVDGPVLVTPSLFNAIMSMASHGSTASVLIGALRGLYTLSYALHAVYRWMLGGRLEESDGRLVGLVKRTERSTPLARSLLGTIPPYIEINDDSIIRLIVGRIGDVPGPLLIGPILTRIEIRRVMERALQTVEGFLEHILGISVAGKRKGYTILCGGTITSWTRSIQPQALLRNDALAILSLLLNGKLRVKGHAISPLCWLATTDLLPDWIMKIQYYLFIPDPHQRKKGTILRVETPLYDCSTPSLRKALESLQMAAARAAYESLVPRIAPVPHPLAVIDNLVKKITKTVTLEIVRGLQGVLSLTYETIMSLQAQSETLAT